MTFKQYFSLCNVQARMFLKADASRLKLGYLWWFLEPLIWVGVFYVVFNMILDSGRRGGDFIIFLACGKMAFLWFSKTVVQASGSIVGSAGLVGKIDIQKSLFPMAVVQESLYRQSAVYSLLFVMLMVSGILPALSWLWMVPIAFVMYLMIIAVGLLGAILVCWIRDFQKLIPLAMTFLLFTSGIFWDVRGLESQQKTDFILAVNPLAFMLDAHRQVLMHHTSPDALHLLAIAAGASILILVALSFMRRRSQFLALKVLT